MNEATTNEVTGCHNPPRPDICRGCKVKINGETPLRIPEKRSKPIVERRPFKGFARRGLPCHFESSILDHSSGDENGHVRMCANPKTPWNKCTRLKRDGSNLQSCEDCPIEYYAPRTNLMEWVTIKRLVEDSVVLASMLPKNLKAVVGIPRSGMIPASVIATYLQLPLGEIARDGRIRYLNHGSRGFVLGFDNQSDDCPILILDDTVYSGTAMRRIKEPLKSKNVIYGTIYCNPVGLNEVDIYVKRLAGPHLLEWNAFNNPPMFGMNLWQTWKGGGAVDMDGILCHDEFSPGISGTPYMVPRRKPLKLICTGRHETHRPGTEAWLKEQGIEFERLEMLPNGELHEIKTVARFKARHFKESECGIFFESCPHQAKYINQYSGKPVVCPIIAHVFQ